MQIHEILTDNFVFIYELIGLFVLLGIGVNISERTKNLTRAVVILMAIETVFFYVEQWTQTFDHVTILRPLLTAAIYSLYPIILILITRITTTATFTRDKLLILLIPEIICVPLFFTSQWTHYVCFFHEPNTYAGGPLSWLPYFLFAFYVVVFVVYNFLYFRRSAPADLWVLAVIFLLPVAGVLLYVLTDSGRDYNAIFISAMVLYYMYVYIHMSKIDPLTSLLNRQGYYKAIQTNRSITGVVSVDMNDLKVLNDTYGHEAGDKALRAVSDVMRDYCGHGGTVYRVGGDEFMIFYNATGEEEIRTAIETMRAKMAEMTYMCAFGYSMTRPDATIEDTIRESDEKMYADKVRMKTGRK